MNIQKHVKKLKTAGIVIRLESKLPIELKGIFNISESKERLNKFELRPHKLACRERKDAAGSGAFKIKNVWIKAINRNIIQFTIIPRSKSPQIIKHIKSIKKNINV